MTPKTQAEVARELWEKAKQEDGFTEDMKMAYIMGAVDAMQRVQNECYVKGVA